MLFLKAGNLAPRPVELVAIFAAGEILRARLELVAETECQPLPGRAHDAALEAGFILAQVAAARLDDLKPPAAGFDRLRRGGSAWLDDFELAAVDDDFRHLLPQLVAVAPLRHSLPLAPQQRLLTLDSLLSHARPPDLVKRLDRRAARIVEQ